MKTVFAHLKLLFVTIYQLVFFKPKWNKKNKALVFEIKFRPAGYAGYTIGNFVWIYEGSRDDRGLREHEFDHVRDFYENLPGSLIKWVSKKYRLRSEVRAYKKQMQYGLSLDRAAVLLSTRYPFGLSVFQAKNLLSTPSK